MIDLMHLPDLLSRYQANGPRYTSYPTALHFDECFGVAEYEELVAQSNQAIVPRALSLYIHIPFCASLCYYCGCNKVITKNTERATNYIELLGKEIELRAKDFSGDRFVEQIHFGGGTPTFLSSDQIREILELVAQEFHLGLPSDLEMGIEIDPRSVTLEELDRLIDVGFNRLSFGIQDLNPIVQAAVNRTQSLDDIQALVEHAKARGVRSISFDLIYGLPHQTIASFEKTLSEVIRLKPDRLALYNYAHMPSKMPAQRLINENDLPDGESKLHILSGSIAQLVGAGYEYIGMDHFALPEDSLAQARNAGTLQRNFQGYSTHAKTDLIGLGVSAISNIDEGYSQNHTSIKAYQAALEKETLPVAKGLNLSRDDVIRADIIQRLMCQGELNYDEFGMAHDLNFREYFAKELSTLSQLILDGLLERSTSTLKVTSTGRVLLRNIAMCFDSYLGRTLSANESEIKYSKTI